MKHLRLLCLLMIIVLAVAPHPFSTSAQNDDSDSPYRVDVLAVDDSLYPTLDLYVNVVNPITGEVVSDLLPTDFTIQSDGTPFSIQAFDVDPTANRPLQLMIVLDLSSSVSLTEFENMRTAAITLIRTLNVDDEVGVIAVDNNSTRTLQPLFIDHNAAINAMFADDVGPASGEAGNAITDGLLRAVESFTESAPNTRPTIVLFTDVSNGSIGGEATLDTVEAVAQQRGAAIYTLYFEAEDDEGVPINATTPQELEALADSTGGLLLQTSGEQNPQVAGDYDDDTRLPQLAERMGAILATEYRLGVLSPLPADNTINNLQIRANVNGTETTAATTFFRARDDIIEVVFEGLENGERVQLPVDVRVRVLASSNPIVRLQLFQVDNDSGDEILLAELPIDNPIFTLTPEDIAAGTLSLRVVAYDNSGDQSDAFLTLVVSGPNIIPTLTPTNTLTPPPTLTTTPTQTDTLPPISTTTDITPSPTATNLPSPSSEQTSSSPNEPFIPLALVLVGIAGILLASFGLWRFMRRHERSNNASTSDPERPTMPRRPNPNDPTGAILSASVQQTIATESTPDKGIWQKALENADTTAMPAINSGLELRALLIGKKNEQYPLYEGENTVGRHSSNQVQILEATISRYHAVIEIYGDSIFVQDWQASHPTMVNGKPLAKGERRALQHGDEIRFGATTLRFLLHK